MLSLSLVLITPNALNLLMCFPQQLLKNWSNHFLSFFLFLAILSVSNYNTTCDLSGRFLVVVDHKIMVHLVACFSDALAEIFST